MYEDDSTPDAVRVPRHPDAGTARVRPGDSRGAVYTDDAARAAELYDEFYSAVVDRCSRIHDGCRTLQGVVGDATTALAAVAGELDDKHDAALAGVVRAEVRHLHEVAVVLDNYSAGAAQLVTLFSTIRRPDFVQVTP